MACLGAAACLVSGMVLAGRLTPSASGLGTHLQLGLPPCTMPLFTGYPCPTCGVTTAIAYAARGELVASAAAQPAGLALFTILPIGAVFALRTAILGRKLPTLHLSPLAAIAGIAGILLAGWAWKVVHGLCTGRLPL